MSLADYRCKNCGGTLAQTEQGSWECLYCGSVYHEENLAKNIASLRQLFDEEKLDIICNLRRNLYDAVNADFVSSNDVRRFCEEIKKYLPDDFAANFYEAAISNNVKRLTKYIRQINVEENYDELSSVVGFLIRSLQTEYLLELNNLVERAYKTRDLALFEKFSTDISIEAEKVVNGVYETKMPREVFVAYSSKDMETVSELVEVLEEQGLRCFVAARNLRHGKGSVENYDKLLREAMDHCKTVVFVSSANSRSFNCDALTKELPYVQQKDIENAPAEYKNNYASMPHGFKKMRVEYRIEESKSFNAADYICNEFFDGYERVYSPEAVAERIAKQIMSMPTEEAVSKSAVNSAKITEQSNTSVVTDRTNVNNLLKRAFLFLEDEDWQSAGQYSEKVLDIDPENANAYIVKLMVDMSVKRQDDLAKCREPFENNGNFIKALRFGDEALGQKLNGYLAAIKENAENHRKDEIYNEACERMKKNSIVALQEAISKFDTIPSWRDSEEKTEDCKRKIDELKEKEKIVKINRRKNFKRFAIVASVLVVCILLVVFVAYPLISYQTGNYAPYIKMYNIKEFEIPDGVTNIGDYAFRYCTSLTNITIPDGVTNIGNSAFCGCNSLTNITIPDGVKSIGDYAFYECNSLTNITIPDGVTSIGDDAFRNCNSLTKITIPDSVTSISDGAFYGCDSLTNITIPDSVTSIGNYAFKNCYSLTNITIPDNVTSIGDYAFEYCNSLTKITIPDSVTSIGNYAFAGCDNLKTVYFTGTKDEWANISIGLLNYDLKYATIIYNYVPEE